MTDAKKEAERAARSEPVNAEKRAEQDRPAHFVPIFREDKQVRWVKPEEVERKCKRLGYVECEMQEETVRTAVPKPKVAVPKLADGPTELLSAKTVPELKEIAKGMNVEGYANLKKDELVTAILTAQG